MNQTSFDRVEWFDANEALYRRKVRPNYLMHFYGSSTNGVIGNQELSATVIADDEQVSIYGVHVLGSSLDYALVIDTTTVGLFSSGDNIMENPDENPIAYAQPSSTISVWAYGTSTTANQFDFVITGKIEPTTDHLEPKD